MRPSWTSTYETLAMVLHHYSKRATGLPLEWQRRAAEGKFKGVDVRDLKFERTTAAGVPGGWFRHSGAPDDAVLYYLHGGGYSIGSLKSHFELIRRLSKASGMAAFALEYRLAPEHRYPAQLEDALAAYDWLLQRFDPKRIVIAGESAGGGLTMSTLVSLRERRTPMPAAAVLISPWMDLEQTSGSAIDNEPYDYLSRKALRVYAQRFVKPSQLREPLAAPIHAELHDLPPILIHAGGAEVILDDSTRLADKLAEAGVDYELVVWKDMIHAFHLFAPLVPEGQEAVDAVGAFVRAKVFGE
jgi:monoterpene epsilon-lactone hydrolase